MSIWIIGDIVDNMMIYVDSLYIQRYDHLFKNYNSDDTYSKFKCDYNH